MMLREIKPKNSRSVRALKRREPRIIENPKAVLFLKSTSSSPLNNGIVTDLHALKRPLAIRFTKKNSIHPFEDPSSLEFFSEKNDASLLCFASHSKKRPHNLTLARTFNAQLLDMLEFLADSETTRLMAQFKGAKSRVGSKPMLSFSGSQFDDEAEHATKFRLAKSLLLDFFHGEDVARIDVEGLQTLISFAASEMPIANGDSRQTVHIRVWRVVTRRSGQRTPRVELEEMGPRIDFRLGRARFADPDLLEETLKRQSLHASKGKKNIETGLMGDKLGRIHLSGQDLAELQTRKMKGLKRARHDESPTGSDHIIRSEDDAGSENYIEPDLFSNYDSDENGAEGHADKTGDDLSTVADRLNPILPAKKTKLR